MAKYKLVVLGSYFGITDFLRALQKRFAFFVIEIQKRESGRYEALVYFSKKVNDEQLKSYLALDHPYASGSVTTSVLASACCCEESRVAL